MTKYGCQDGARLARIYNDQDLLKLYNLLKSDIEKQKIDNGGPDKYNSRYLLGGIQEKDNNQNYFWLDSNGEIDFNDPIKYTSWAETEPNNVSERCLETGFRREILMGWNDITCHGIFEGITKIRGFVCEVEEEEGS